jgi:hypothetical protein
MKVFKSIFPLVASVLFSILMAETLAQAAPNDSQLFAFKFQTNQPLVYAVLVKTKTTTDMNIGGKTSLQSQTMVISYKVRMSYYKNYQDGTTGVYFKPYDLAEDTEMNGTAHLVTQIRGLKIKTLQNNIVTIDTDNNVGMAQAGPIKLSIYPMLMSGYFNFDPTGRIVKFQGDPPFIDYWTNVLSTQIGYFSIFLPNHPVGQQEAWTENASVKYNNGIELDEPITITNTYTREPDLVTNGITVATFDLTSGELQQNISGYFELNGQRSSLNISQFNHNGFGTYHFDQKRGGLLDANATENGGFSVEMMAMGNTVNSQINMEREFQINLIDDPVVPEKK